MTSPEILTPLTRKPRDDEIDIFALTHPGKVRPTNQDHFLLCSLHKQMRVHRTSLPEVDRLPLEGERLAYLLMVADGVGGGARGEEASRLAIEAITTYVAGSMQCYYSADATDENAFSDALEAAALDCHAKMSEKADEGSDQRRMATTLTLVIGVWPRAYLLQVGDSRCYLLRGEQLTQISRDQTMAQELIEQGVLTRTNAYNTKWAHVLSSAIGGLQAAPVVTRVDQEWGNIWLLCSDGLTKHVPDERIHERLNTMTSAKQVCEDLLQEALDGGGSDNITIIVGRAVRKAA